MEKLRRAVIKEELVKLTKDAIKALILNQFLYWTERVKDIDRYIEEEIERAKETGETVKINKTNGWIYKSSEELAEELMNIQSPRTIRRKLSELVEQGYIEQRQNPNNSWDKTPQYRVNLQKVINDLEALGYALEGYPLLSKIQSTGQNDQSIGHSDQSTGQNDQSSGQNDQAIPKIITKIIYNNKQQQQSNILNKPDGQSENKNDDDVVVEKYKTKIDEITGENISINTVIKLIKKYGLERLDKYIEIYPVFQQTQNIKNGVGFFIKALEENYSLPTESRNNRDVAFNQFEQHTYSPEEWAEIEKRLFEDLENS